MNKRRKSKVFNMTLIAVMIISLFGGCFGKETDTPEVSGTLGTSTPAAGVPIQAVSGGEVTLSMRLPKTFNPLLNEDRTVDLILKLLFEPLAVLDEQQKPAPNTAIVESIDYAMDGFSVFITLKDGAVWSDGTPITSRDIAFSIETIRSATDLSVYKNTVNNIFKCDLVSDRSVKINLVQPFSGTPYTMCFPIIPEHYYKDAGKPDSEKNMKPLGNGLYTFNSFNITDGMRLSASANALQGRPYIDTVKVLVTPSAASDISSIDQKIISVVSANISEWGKYKSSNEFRAEEYLTSYFDFIGFNFDREYFRDLSVRQAVAYATPIDSIIETVYMDKAKKSASPVSPDSWLYDGNVKQYAFDIEKTKSLLPQTELSFSILVNVENEERVTVANILKDNLQAAGMNVEVDALPFIQYIDKLNARDYDIFIGGYSLSVIPDLSFALHSSQTSNTAKPLRLSLIEPTPSEEPSPSADPTQTPAEEQTPVPAETPPAETPSTETPPAETAPAQTGEPTPTPEPNVPLPPKEVIIGNNYMNYQSDTMDLMLENAFRAVGDYNYKKSMSDLQKYIAEDLPIIGIGFRQSAVVADKKIQGEIKPSVNNIYQNFKEWFVYEP